MSRAARAPQEMEGDGVVRVGGLAIVVGSMLILFRRRFARPSMEQQRAIWGFDFGPGWVRFTEIMAIIVGSGFVLFGLGVVSGLMHLKGAR